MGVAMKVELVETDVFVVGGGPAGLAAAIAARQKGFRVTVADAARPPIDKACGEGLMPDALAALRALGITPRPGDYFPFRGIRFLGAGVAVDAEFPGAFGLGFRRTRLHRLLVERASESGVSMLWGTRVKGIDAQGVSLEFGGVRCRWVIGADGQDSRVRRWAGLESYQRNTWRFGFRRHYLIPPWTDHMELYWGPGCQIYVTPSGPQEVCVASISADPMLRLDRVLPYFPDVVGRLKNAPLGSAERGGMTAVRSLSAVFRGKVALIGDASGSVDAITGEGLCLAFLQAAALAEALKNDDLSMYQAHHRRFLRRPMFMSELMLGLGRYPWLRRRALRALAADRSLFAKLLAIHVGELSPTGFGVQGILDLGRQMLASG